MKFYRSHDEQRWLKHERWHKIDPKTGLAFCGDDPHHCGEHFEGSEGDDPPDGGQVCNACRHAQHGFKVEKTKSGQVRRYGSSVYQWHVTDLLGTRTLEEVKAYCLEYVSKVPQHGDPKYHSLCEHYQHCRDLGGGVYEYQTGHDWTG